jgi:hypothetical protein
MSIRMYWRIHHSLFDMLRAVAPIRSALAMIVLAGTGAFAQNTDFFEKRIRPVLATKCYGCHGAEKQFGSLRLDSRDRILRGGGRGAAAIPGKPDESLLVQAIRHQGLAMPVGGKLQPAEIAAFEEWIVKGMTWPEDQPVKLAAGDPGFYAKLMREHWAFQPVVEQKIPDGSGKNPVDRFINAKLATAGISMAAPANRNMLARRAAFILTGLPPKPAELAAFLNDKSPQAYERFVDKLIASPHFGERWARHWMDVVRFAETYGYEWNYEINQAWRYRDYLIRAFNADVPYDQFVREHVAGDLLAKPRTLDGRQNESVLATAFFRLGEMGHDNCNQFRELRTDVVDNQIDTLTKAFQGLTVSCARCHDHKIDPIPTEDYYALYGILNSSRPVTRTLDLAGPDSAVQSKLTALKSDIRKELAAAWIRETSELGRNLVAAIAWENDAPDAAETARNLQPAQINRVRKLLQRTKVDMSDPLYAISRWMKDRNAESWAKLTAEFQKEAAEREKFNKEKFVVFADFRANTPSGWSADGWGFRTGRAADGAFAVATEGGDAVAGIYTAGIFTNLLSDRLNGVLRSPLLPRDKKFLTMQMAGGKLGAFRLIMDDCVIGEDHQLLKNPQLKWIRTTSKNDQPLPTYLEISTKADNPRLPERPEKFNDVTEEQLASPRSFWGVSRILLNDEAVEPKAELHHLDRLLKAQAPQNVTELASRVQTAVQNAILAWSEDRATAGDIVWLNWLIETELVTNSRNVTPKLRSLTDEYRNAEASINKPAVVYSMADVDPGQDYPILIGGQATAPGRPAPRHFLSVMPESLRKVNLEQSGRLEMAEAMASKDNPLTSRVMVNRLWHHVFGRGLVATTDNFGRYGEAPTHPELLDYLASRFIEDGWSMKKMIRLMVTSETFQQSSQGDKRANEADPQNRLWHRYPIRRLEGEAVRDAILATSGVLNEKLYGPSIPPHREEAKPYRRLYQGPLDGEGRRSIYLKVTRMEGTRFLETFDFPQPMQTRGNRDVTNVPSQALAMLNDPFVTDQSKVWAERLTARKDDAVDARLAAMFESALGRPPSQDELARMRALVNDFSQRQGVAGASILASVSVWKDVAHTFFNMKEFIYLR